MKHFILASALFWFGLGAITDIIVTQRKCCHMGVATTRDHVMIVIGGPLSFWEMMVS